MMYIIYFGNWIQGILVYAYLYNYCFKDGDGFSYSFRYDIFSNAFLYLGKIILSIITSLLLIILISIYLFKFH